MKTSSGLFLLLLITFLSPLCAYTQNSHPVEGTITDFDTGLPLKNVSVIIKENKKGTITDDSGYFSLQVTLEIVTLQFSTIGYVNSHRKINLSENREGIAVVLKKQANEQLDEVVVNTNQNNNKVKMVEMNIIKINPELIKRSPLLIGEADIIKALLLQPGITTVGEGAGGFNVRGGNADQNLVLIDGAPLFNTSHLLGFYTSVSPDAIQDIILYKGGMPAQYGGRLSSLLNMKTKNGNNNKMQYSGGVSPMTGRFYVNGPLIKNKLTVNGGIRIAYPNFILNQLSGSFGDSRAFFYDGLLKTEYTLNTNNKIALTAYRSYDKFRFDPITIYDWETNLASVNFTSTLSNKFSIKLNANYSQFISGIEGREENYQYKLNSSITHKELKASAVYTLSESNQIELGANAILYDISPGTQKPTGAFSNINASSLQKEQGREVAAFINDEINLSDKISLHAGLRYARYDYLGPKNIYQYENGIPLAKETIKDTLIFTGKKNIHNYSGLEPRLALKIGLSDDLSIKLSYNRGQQFLHLISNTTSISPVDFWKLSDPFIKQQKGDQYAFGVFKNYKNNQYEASIETYYKTTKNIVQYKDGAQLLMNPYIESALLNSRGKGYGIEFSVTKNTGKFTGQVNYTYSNTEVQVVTIFPSEQINNSEWYPSDYDRPHNIAIITRLKLGRGWSFNNNFIFISGRPATYPDGNYSFNGTLVNNYSKRNMDRLPTYHRLDAGFSYVSKRFPQQTKYSVWNFSFYNLYMRKNAYSVFFMRSRDELFFAREKDRLIPYQLSVIGGIIPSISWNYYF